VAKTYAESGGRAATMFEIKMGMVDRGADISGFSQYPHEKEICFAPLTGIEVEGKRVEGSLLVVQARLNINLAAMTLEQVVFKRKRLVVDMCSNLQLETENFLSGMDEQFADQLLRRHGILSGQETLREYCISEFKKVKETNPEVFNDDGQFREMINHTISIKEFAFPNAQVGTDMIEAVGKAGKAAGALVGLIATRLRDNDDDIRIAAAKAIVHIAEKGNSCVIKALLALLRDSNCRVRAAAAGALGQVTEKGNRDVTEALIGGFEDSDWEAKIAAAQAHAQVADSSDRRGIDALIGAIEHSDGMIKVASAHAHAQVVDSTDRRGSAALLACLLDEEGRVRASAASALGRATEKGNRDVIEALVARIGDKNGDVREAAAVALGHVTEKGDPVVIEVLVSKLADLNWYKRQVAAMALGAVAEKGDQQVIEALQSMDVSDRWNAGHVRKARDEALRSLASA